MIGRIIPTWSTSKGTFFFVKNYLSVGNVSQMITLADHIKYVHGEDKQHALQERKIDEAHTNCII